MFENILKFFKKAQKEKTVPTDSKSTAKERLHLVLMQDRANVSADFLDLMKQEIIEVIKKYIEVDENAIDVRLTNKENEDGSNGAPALYANIPIINIKNEARKIDSMSSTKREEKNNQVNENKPTKDDNEQKNSESTSENKEKIDNINIEKYIEDIQKKQHKETTNVNMQDNNKLKYNTEKSIGDTNKKTPMQKEKKDVEDASIKNESTTENK